MRVWFDPDDHSEQSQHAARVECIAGETVDLSRSGIAFTVPAIRFNEKYLVGQERTLNVEIDLPTGKIYARVVGRRYEMTGIHLSRERFLVGAYIIEMPGPDKENYETFLRTGGGRTTSIPAEMVIPAADKY